MFPGQRNQPKTFSALRELNNMKTLIWSDLTQLSVTKTAWQSQNEATSSSWLKIKMFNKCFKIDWKFMFWCGYSSGIRVKIKPYQWWLDFLPSFNADIFLLNSEFFFFEKSGLLRQYYRFSSKKPLCPRIIVFKLEDHLGLLFKVQVTAHHPAPKSLILQGDLYFEKTLLGFRCPELSAAFLCPWRHVRTWASHLLRAFRDQVTPEVTESILKANMASDRPRRNVSMSPPMLPGGQARGSKRPWFKSHFGNRCGCNGLIYRSLLDTDKLVVFHHSDGHPGTREKASFISHVFGLC